MSDYLVTPYARTRGKIISSVAIVVIVYKKMPDLEIYTGT